MTFYIWSTEKGNVGQMVSISMSRTSANCFFSMFLTKDGAHSSIHTDLRFYEKLSSHLWI